MNVYILESESYYENGEHIGDHGHGVFATKELAEQMLSTLSEWHHIENDWSIHNKYTIHEVELIGA